MVMVQWSMINIIMGSGESLQASMSTDHSASFRPPVLPRLGEALRKSLTVPALAPVLPRPLDTRKTMTHTDLTSIHGNLDLSQFENYLLSNEIPTTARRR